MRCLVIDDEPLARENLEDYIRMMPGLEIAASFSSAPEAMEFIQESDVDIIFLDIQMPRLNGIQFLEGFKPGKPVIITTAFEKYALKGYELDVVDYLLKPITFERFTKAVDKIKERNNLRAAKSALRVSGDNCQDILFVKSEYRMVKIKLSDLLYVEGLKDYLIFRTEHEKVLSLMSFKDIEPYLKPPEYIRVHKSFLVSLAKITSVERSLINIFGKQIPIGKSYRNVFFGIFDDCWYICH